MAENKHIVVVGAGVGGLSAAIWARIKGFQVTVLEKEPRVGGKMRQVEVAGRHIDGGPTVITMPWVFKELFEQAGTTLEEEIRLEPLEVLARHFWPNGDQLDLFMDIDRSAEAIADFAGQSEGEGYLRYIERGRRIYDLVGGQFIYSKKPSMTDIARSMIEARFIKPWELDLHHSMWKALGSYFKDERMKQLFGRYATYYGSSPFKAPGILNLIAHVEQRGVWVVADGGLYRIAEALERTLLRLGGTLRCETRVESIAVGAEGVEGVVLDTGEEMNADVVVFNADARALGAGLFGDHLRKAVAVPSREHRALSAVVFALVADVGNFPLVRHTVFFSRDYPAEFQAIFDRGELPEEPTVYICAQDRGAQGRGPSGPERLFIHIHAAPRGDVEPMDAAAIEGCEKSVFSQLDRCGLKLDPTAVEKVVTTPTDFDRLFPATGGALFGIATHGIMASFKRPGSRTKVRGLYLSGGAVHPGAGVPMTAISGKVAVEAICEDLGLTSS